ncbi:protein kinase domain-containing protein, partial [Streptomyces mayonensis]|uniref:protein kinase domain-containing protein n=1 Tax=Streptomyces mayonensis TaxID=2750816 RepID=UPI001C1E7C35
MGWAQVSAQELLAGRYRLSEVVHRETNRVSWSGEDTATGRPCLVTAVELPQDRTGGTARRAAARVLRTGAAVAALCPGRTAQVVDAVVADGSLWTVTDWAGGAPLGDLLDRHGTFGPVRAARVGLELLSVLEAAHGRGITHGELSPGQVFVREDGSVVVTGFGLAGTTLAPRLAAPAYASPEQARDERIGPAADLWTLGALLYTMVEGHPPFRDRGRPEATLRGVDRLPLRTPVRAGPLTRAVQGLLRKDSRERLSRPVVRAALVRVLAEDPEAGVYEVSRPPRSGGAYSGARSPGHGWGRRGAVAGTALALVTVTAAALAAAQGWSGGDGGPATDAGRRPSAPATPPADEA